MYTKPYIPRADAAFYAWAGQFCRGIASDPARFMLTPATGEHLMQQFNEFETAFLIAVNQKTRTRGTICDKDDKRSILKSSCRAEAAFIRVNKGITDGDKLGIGVPPENVARHKRRCPSTPPLLQYIGSLPGLNELRYHSSDTPGSKSKPYGAERLELWRAYSIHGGPNAEPLPTIKDAELVNSYKKSKMLIETDLEQEARGARPTYWGRWVGFHGDVGPWSLALNTTIAAREARAVAAKKKATPPNADIEAKPDQEQSDAALKIAA